MVRILHPQKKSMNQPILLRRLALCATLLVFTGDGLASPTPHGPRIAARVRLARMKLKQSRAGQLATSLGHRLSQGSMLLRGQMTRAADRVERSASPRLSGAFHRARALSPLSIGAFALHQFRSDKTFLMAFGAYSFGLYYLQTPLLLGLGVSPTITAGVGVITGLPLELALLIGREHHRRKKLDPSIRLKQTLRDLGHEYGSFLVQRRTENRQFMQRRQGALSQIAAPLATP